MSNDPVANLTREFVKSYAKNNGLENDNIVNAVADLTSSIINPESPTPEPSATATTTTTEETSQPDAMGKLFGGLFGNLNQHRGPSSSTNSSTYTVVGQNTTPYQLINNYYGTLWGKTNMDCIKQYLTIDAMYSCATTTDSEQWRITSRNKIVEYFQQLWIPKVKNTSTMIYKFNFSIDSEETDCTYCTVDYTITQTQLDTDTMKWIKYQIESTDKLVLMQDNGNYRFYSLTSILRHKEVIEEESQY